MKINKFRMQEFKLWIKKPITILYLVLALFVLIYIFFVDGTVGVKALVKVLLLGVVLGLIIPLLIHGIAFLKDRFF